MPSPNAPLKRVLAYTGCFSRMSTIKDIHEYLSQRLRIKEEDMRLWLYNSEVRFSAAQHFHCTLLICIYRLRHTMKCFTKHKPPGTCVKLYMQVVY